VILIDYLIERCHRKKEDGKQQQKKVLIFFRFYISSL